MKRRLGSTAVGGRLQEIGFGLGSGSIGRGGMLKKLIGLKCSCDFCLRHAAAVCLVRAMYRFCFRLLIKF